MDRKRLEDPRIRFARHLAACRKERGWSQEKLALESGIARSYLDGVKRGKRNIALLNICRLADALDVPPARLSVLECLRKSGTLGTKLRRGRCKSWPRR